MTKEKIKKECELCGAIFYTKASNAKYCTECRKVATSKLKRDSRQHIKMQGNNENNNNKHYKSTLDEKLAELRKYNESHNTYLSYGQFMLMRERINA